jgi:hypothetical protein
MIVRQAPRERCVAFMHLTSLRPRRRRPADAPRALHHPTRRTPDLPAIAGRIAGLTDGPVSEALVVMLTELYGEALEQILETIAQAPDGDKILERLYDDGLVGGLLVVHDLHPHPLRARVERALAALARGSADPLPVALDRIEDDVVYVRLTAPAGPTVRAAIARAIAAAAPEIARVSAEVDSVEDRTLHF